VTELGEVAGLVLRPATERDRAFLLAVYSSTRVEELAVVGWSETALGAFLLMQFKAQDTEYRRLNPNARFDVVEVDGRRAGRLYVDRRPDTIRILDIALLPQFRGQGIGERLIRPLLDEAAGSGRTVSIHVEVNNPAEHLYVRLGFVKVDDGQVYRRMEWSA
jgi:ribosomal protein S18 acetylase RimI-like enzyme